MHTKTMWSSPEWAGSCSALVLAAAAAAVAAVAKGSRTEEAAAAAPTAAAPRMSSRREKGMALLASGSGAGILPVRPARPVSRDVHRVLVPTGAADRCPRWRVPTGRYSEPGCPDLGRVRARGTRQVRHRFAILSRVHRLRPRGISDHPTT